MKAKEFINEVKEITYPFDPTRYKRANSLLSADQVKEKIGRLRGNLTDTQLAELGKISPGEWQPYLIGKYGYGRTLSGKFNTTAEDEKLIQHYHNILSKIAYHPTVIEQLDDYAFIMGRSTLVEANESHSSFVALLKRASTTPIIGNKYIVASIIWNGEGKFANIATDNNKYELVEITSTNVFVKIGRRIKQFPEIVESINDLNFQATILFDNLIDREHLLIMLNLSFPDWTISLKKLSLVSRISEDVSLPELNQVEELVNALWSKMGIEVEFTRHFLERINDTRNIKDITVEELAKLFVEEYKKYGMKIRELDDHDEAVFKDIATSINLPFVIKTHGYTSTLVAKTVMRKKNFSTSNPVFPIDSKGQ